MLRWYQEESIKKTREEWGKGNNPTVVVLPTGMGKTFIFAHMAIDAARSGKRVVILVNRDVLVEQTAAEIRALNRLLAKNGKHYTGRIGIVRGTANQVDSGIIIASVQTLQRSRRRNQIRNVGMVIVDECHLAMSDSYMDIMRDFGCFEGTPTVGFTATPMHNTRKFGDVFHTVAFRMSVLQGIAGGWICDAKGYRVDTDLDLRGVSKSGGDFAKGSLSEAMIGSNAAIRAAEAVKQYCPDQPGIVFTPNVAAAEMYAEVFTQQGIPLACISKDTKREERARIFKARRAGDLMGYANCNTLTAGFDDPPLAWVIPCPTQSQVKYIQQVGRVMRTYRDPATDYVKPHATVLDLTGVSATQSLMCLPDLTQSTRPREVAEGESLREASKRWREDDKLSGWLDIEDEYDEPLMMRAVDLFANSTSEWIRTYSGMWVIPTRECFYYLWEQPPNEAGNILYSVGRTATTNSFYPMKPEEGEDIVRPLPPIETDLPLDMAMMVAEQIAVEEDPSIARRSSSWKRGHASSAQVALATSYGLDWIGKNRGEIARLISTYKASALLDWLA